MLIDGGSWLETEIKYNLGIGLIALTSEVESATSATMVTVSERACVTTTTGFYTTS
jgi:hypothetical protein